MHNFAKKLFEVAFCTIEIRTKKSFFWEKSAAIFHQNVFFKQLAKKATLKQGHTVRLTY